MNRVAAIAGVACSCWLLTWAASAMGAKPNVLFIAVDDLRPELGCYGGKEIRSPHLDRLATGSVVFTRAYCQQAVCNPSRASVLTGLRPDANKVWDLRTHFRDTTPDVITLPQHFRAHGYRAAAYGKIFHNPLPDRLSWDEPNQWPQQARAWSQASLQRLLNFRRQMRADGKSERAIARMRAPAIEDEDVEDAARPDGEIADLAVAAMQQFAEQSQPFFLAVGFVKPHLPFNAPKKYWDMYDPRQITLSSDTAPPAGSPPTAMNTMYELRDYMDFADAPMPNVAALSLDKQRQLKHGYYAAVSYADAQVGKLVSELDRLQLRDNTIIVLWGDHGWKLGEHRSWCKQTNYEIDTRVPLIIRTPSGRPKICDSIVELLDIYPTLCELAGLPAPEHIQGQSMAPLLAEGTAPHWKNVAVSQFRRRTVPEDRETWGQEAMGYALRTERYRFVEWIHRDTCETVAFELYDHTTDPTEQVNIAPRRKQAADALSAQLWSRIPRPQAGQLARQPPRATATLRFRNLRSQAVELFWVRADGSRVSQGKVLPGKTAAIRTFITHRFQAGAKGRVITVKKTGQLVILRETGQGAPDKKQ